VLDPGHGGYDSGARIRKGPAEKDLTLDVVRRLAPKLRDAGFRTIITRKSDVFIPLDTRAEISAPEKNAVFVSVHFNDGGRSSAYGVESYYFSPESKQMANRMVHIFAATTGTPDRGARVARFRVLRTNRNPAVLMECGYLSSGREASFITQPQYREKIALALAKGIIEQRGGPLNGHEPTTLHIDTPAY
jgi:N-acetylmuramoyl-L-alanine amidase